MILHITRVEAAFAVLAPVAVFGFVAGFADALGAVFVAALVGFLLCLVWPLTRGRSPSGQVAAFAAAAICCLTTAAYVMVIASQRASDPGESESPVVLVFSAIILGLAALSVVGAVARVRALLWANTVGLVALGVLGMFSIGFPLLIAAALTGTAAASMGDQPAGRTMSAWPVGKSLRLLVLALAAFLLLSMGGSIIAAPVTLPGLFFARRSSHSRAYRIAAATVAALTAAQVTWAAVYVAVGEAKPAIWALPLATGAATLLLFVATGTGRGASLPRSQPRAGAQQLGPPL